MGDHYCGPWNLGHRELGLQRFAIAGWDHDIDHQQTVGAWDRFALTITESLTIRTGSAAMADTYVVERTQKIAASPVDVFAHVVDLHEWENWSPWAAMDPTMTTTYTGDPGQVGSRYHWTGNRRVGEGQMTVTDVETPTRVAIDLQFIKPFKSESVAELLISPDGEGTQVTWRMTGEHTRMTKIMGIFRSMDKMVGPDFEKGLTSLKKLAET